MPSLCSSGPMVSPGRAAFDQEPGELLAVDLREHREQIGEARVGDVLLGAGQLPGLAVGRKRRPGLGRQRVRPRAGFGQRVGGDEFAGRQPGQVLFPLRRRAEQDDRHGPNPHVRAVAHGEAPQPADRLGDEAGAGLVAAETPVGLGNVVTKQAHLARLLQDRPHQAGRLAFYLG